MIAGSSYTCIEPLIFVYFMIVACLHAAIWAVEVLERLYKILVLKELKLKQTLPLMQTFVILCNPTLIASIVMPKYL